MNINEIKALGTLYIFGGGYRGKFLTRVLSKEKVVIKAVLDNDETKHRDDFYENIACISPQAASDRKLPLLVPLFNSENRKIVIKELKNIYKFQNIVEINADDYREFIESIDDKTYIEVQWDSLLNYPLNWKAPQSFNEKIQWLKMYDHKLEYNMMVDKYEVKSYVEKKIGIEHIIPTIGVWNSFDEINFDTLPEKFVLKCTHNSGGNAICYDRQAFNFDEAREILNECMKRDYFYEGREWPYKGLRRRIIAERYMVDESGIEIKDYKVHCFNGIPKLIQVDYGRFFEHKRNLYDTKWNYLEAIIKYPTDRNYIIPKPHYLEKLLKLAETLSEKIPYVRVDFYIIKDNIYFGELTFHHGAGYEKITPHSLDFEMGSWINIEGIADE